LKPGTLISSNKGNHPQKHINKESIKAPMNSQASLNNRQTSGLGSKSSSEQTKYQEGEKTPQIENHASNQVKMVQPVIDFATPRPSIPGNQGPNTLRKEERSPPPTIQIS